MKKILSLCLAALMIFSVLPAAFAAEVETSIEETSEYAEALKFLTTLRVYKGRADGDLAAEAGVQRYEAALFIYRVATGDVEEADIKTTTNYTNFKDIEIGSFDGSSAESLGAIAWASQAKITNGTAADKFSPSNGIIYQDAITMIVRLLGERYTAASYPYGFVTTARELGITAGITGVGLEEEINRGVFAQLLYNAMFAKVLNEKTDKYESLAEKVFNVKKDTVLITASANAYYETSGAKAKSGYVGFKTIDAQGEPVGYQYHAPIARFDLADNAAANAAVGNAYVVYHTANFENIISARSLSKVYWNLGHDALTVKPSFSSNGNTSYITVAGSKYTVVNTYSDLRNNQLAGNDEVKIYKSTGGQIATGSSNYFKDNDNNIWSFDSEKGLVLYARYIDALDQWYREVDGQFVLGSYDDIVANAGSKTSKLGFTKLFGELSATNLNPVNPALYHSAYAKFSVTDANDDGYADRVTMREYSFGQFTKTKKTKTNGTAVEVFSIKSTKTCDNSFATGHYDWATNDKGSASWDAGAEHARKSEYRFTGLTYDKVANNSFILYYIDNDNKEVEILEVISGAKAGETDDTYVVSGYVRNMDVTSDKIVLDNGTVYTVGYDTLKASPLKTKNYRENYSDSNYASSNFNLANNVSLLHKLLNTYVTLYVVDNKVVYIANASVKNDFVIIDSFVSFEEDAIVAKAYTTVGTGGEYTEIKIKGYNGWNVGGFDYYLYFLSTLIPGYNYNKIPFSLNTIYRVASIDSKGYYDLRDATPMASGAKKTLLVNEYGYITGTDGAGNLGVDRYKLTGDKDYWLILDLDADNDPVTENDAKVYAYSGKLNPITLQDVVVYKCAENDFVLVASDTTKLDSMGGGLFGGDVKFMLYNKEIAQTFNEGWMNTETGYNYQIWMTNMLTGALEPIIIDSKLVKNQWNGYQFSVISLEDDKIYKVVDNTLYADSGKTTASTVTLAEVAEYYGKVTGNVASGSFTKAGVADKTSNSAYVGGIVYEAYNAFVDEIAKKVADKLYGNWEVTDVATNTRFLGELKKKITFYGKYDAPVDTALKFLTKDAKVLGDTGAVYGDAADKWTLKDTSLTFTVYYVIGADGTTTAWVEKP